MSSPAFRSFTAIYVTPLRSRTVIHYEVYEATDLPTEVELKRARDRMRELAVTYPLDQYDIAKFGYSSMDAMRSHHPELDIADPD